MKPPKSRKAELAPNAMGGGKSHAEAAESAEFKMTELGPIPVDWEVKEISDLYEVRSSKRVFQSQWRASGIPFYRARDIVGFRHGEKAIGGLFIDKALYEKYKRDYGVPSIGDLLVTAVGTLGNVFRVCNESPFYFKDGNIIWFKFKGKYDSQLLEVLFESGFLDSQIYDTAGGSTVGTYTISNAKKTLVPFPPLAEQRRIAGALSDVDELISALGKLIEKKRNIKTGAMQQLLTGKTRLPGFGAKRTEFKQTELGPIPVDWEVKRLGECCTRIRNGFTYSVCNSGVYKVSRIETISKGVVNYSRVGYVKDEPPADYMLCNGDILFSHINSLPYIGNVALYDGKELLYHGMNLLLLRRSESVDAKYLYYALSSVPMRSKARELAKIAINQASISISDLSRSEIPIPPIAEQRRITGVLSDMDAEIAALEADRAKYERIKSGMMQELLTGKTRLRNGN